MSLQALRSGKIFYSRWTQPCAGSSDRFYLYLEQTSGRIQGDHPGMCPGVSMVWKKPVESERVYIQTARRNKRLCDHPAFTGRKTAVPAGSYAVIWKILCRIRGYYWWDRSGRMVKYLQFGHELNSIIKIKADRNSLKNKKIGQLFVVYYLLI